MTDSTPDKASQPLRLAQLVVLCLAGIWAFSPALAGGWVWDDAAYLPANPLLHDPARLWKIWFVPGTFAEYYPLTATVQFIEWRIFGNHTLYYHMVSLALHLAGALLVWRLFEKLGLRLAWLGALLFAVHPLTVESVAWISEQKNTLSLPLFVAAMLFYLEYDEKGRERDYQFSLGFFLAAMLAKITMAAFPVVILLYAWWKRGTVTVRDLRAAGPFLVISLVLTTLSILTAQWYGQVHPSAASETLVEGWLGGPVSAGVAIFVFIARFIWTPGLTLIYPRWLDAGVQPSDFLPWLAAAAVVAWLWWKKDNRWCRDVLLGLGFYLLMLVPVFGFIVMNYTQMVWSLDHLAYLPMIGLAGLAAAALGVISDQLMPRQRLVGLMFLMVIFIALLAQTHAYARAFRNGLTLWSFALEQNPHSWVAHDAMGGVLQQIGRPADAMQEYVQAAQLNPLSADPHSNMAHILLQAGRAQQALTEYAEAVRLSPGDAVIRYNAGDALAQLGHVKEAIGQFQQAIKIDPDLAEAHYNLGNALVQTQNLPDAAQEYEAALRLNPDYEEAHANLGNVLLQAGRVQDALGEYADALKLNPNDTDVHNNIGVVMMQDGNLAEAQAQFQKVLQLDPQNALAKAGLARLSQPAAPAAPAPASAATATPVKH